MHFDFLKLLQLSSPNLPLGAYSYSEGLETLVEEHKITSAPDLGQWLSSQLQFGSIRVETAIMARSYRSFQQGEIATVNEWNHYLSANRETQELRQQSWQMGKSLIRLMLSLETETPLREQIQQIQAPCNYGIAFGVVANIWHIQLPLATLAYLQTWVNNLIMAGIKLIPLGQTQGQQLLSRLNHEINRVCPEILALTDDQLYSCNVGLSLASMNHERLYSRLFRS